MYVEAEQLSEEVLEVHPGHSHALDNQKAARRSLVEKRKSEMDKKRQPQREKQSERLFPAAGDRKRQVLQKEGREAGGGAEERERERERERD